MKSSLAPHNASKTILAFAVLIAAGKLTAAETTPVVDTNSEVYKKAYEKAYVEEKARLAAKQDVAGAAATPAAPVAPVTASETKTAEIKPAAQTTTDTNGDGQIADVTVTAKKEVPAKPYVAETQTFKRPTPLQDTPQQITVVSQQLLQDRHAVDLKDALKNSPGITYNAGEGGNSGGDNFNMRGFNAQSDIFVDGIRDTALYNRDVFSVEQVEVAKGASGAYMGRGSTGGSINLTTKKAHVDDAGSLELSGSTADSVRAVADANFDLSKHIEAIADQGLAFRIAVMGQDGGTPRTQQNEDSRFGILPTLSYGLGKDTTVTLSHEYYTQNTDGDYGIPYGPPLGTTIPAATAANSASNRSNYSAYPVSDSNWYGVKGVTHDDTTANITTAIIESKIDDNNTLRNVTRYNDNLRDTIIYRPNGGTSAITGGTVVYNAANPGQSTIQPTLNNRYVQTNVLSNQTDLISKFKTGDIGHTLNIGVELQEEQSSNRSRLAIGPAPTLNLFNPNANTVGTQSFVFSGAKTVAIADTYAVYLNDTASITKWLDLVGGVRYDRYEASVKNYGADTKLNGTATGTIANTATFVGPVQTVLGPGQTASFSNDNNLIGYNGSVVLKPNDKLTVYGTIASSYIPSAQNLALSAGNATSGGVFNSTNAGADPEQIMLYEVGSKWEPVKDRLTFGAAVFYIDAFNVPQTSATNPLEQVNVGEVSSYGVEFTAAGAITKKWNVFGGVSWYKTRDDKDTTPANIGKELTNTPDWSATIWTTYDLGMGWAIGGGIRYTGTRWADTLNTAKLDDYVVGDLALYKQINKWCRLQVNVDNVADTHYIETARAQADGWATPGAGRTITGTVRLSF